MDTSISNRSQSYLFNQSRGITPTKSPTTENVQKRRRDIERSERAAYWALFNTSIALLLYYDLCYIGILNRISLLLTYLEWLICFIFTISACYDFMVHFWPHTFMKPIVVNPVEKKLLGIQKDEFGFKVQETPPIKYEQSYDSLPPFEIHHSFEEDEKVIYPSERIKKVMRSEAVTK